MVELQETHVDLPLTLRCPCCGGLRGVTKRHSLRTNALCNECAKGRVVHRTLYHDFWLERFSTDEIYEMAKAIWME